MPPQVQGLSPLACIRCKASKRKCDKHLPKCSLCSSKSLVCKWPNRPTRSRGLLSQPEAVKSLLRWSGEAGHSIVTPSVIPQQIDEFPATFYLDWAAFQEFQLEVPCSSFPVPSYVLAIIRNFESWQAIARVYFSTIDSWMPIISRKRFYGHLFSSYQGHPRSDFALLILCMDLLTWTPPANNPNPKTPTYLAAKSFYLDLEIAGVVSIQVLQAGVLIALFEFGHAIYPSAAVSIEACARYGCALGINWNADAPSKPPPFLWIDLEEQNRVWWAVVMLDRISRIGYPRPTLVTEDPGVHVPLPADDVAWYMEEMPTKNTGVLSSYSRQDMAGMGRFALAAETTRLLGHVLRHLSTDSSDGDIYKEEALVLDRALRALSNVVDYEGHSQRLSMINQAAICSISLILLHERHAFKRTGMSSYFDNVHYAINITELVIKSKAESTNWNSNQQILDSCIREASPFLVTLLYQTASANLRMKQEKRTQESSEAFSVIKNLLNGFNGRWMVSAAYLKLIEADDGTPRISRLLEL